MSSILASLHTFDLDNWLDTTSVSHFQWNCSPPLVSFSGQIWTEHDTSIWFRISVVSHCCMYSTLYGFPPYEKASHMVMPKLHTSLLLENLRKLIHSGAYHFSGHGPEERACSGFHMSKLLFITVDCIGSSSVVKTWALESEGHGLSFAVDNKMSTNCWGDAMQAPLLPPASTPPTLFSLWHHSLHA